MVFEKAQEVNKQKDIFQQSYTQFMLSEKSSYITDTSHFSFNEGEEDQPKKVTL